tara:strand:- start:196 stop:522 length:327 start_codon:yes stop_codon:yes gene_type:complete
MLYFLWKNFQNLQLFTEAKKVVFYGSIFVVVLATCLKLSPSSTSSLIIGLIVPFFYSLAALQISTSMQATKKDIKANTNWCMQSLWNIIIFGSLFYVPWGFFMLGVIS